MKLRGDRKIPIPNTTTTMNVLLLILLRSIVMYSMIIRSAIPGYGSFGIVHRSQKIPGLPHWSVTNEGYLPRVQVGVWDKLVGSGSGLWDICWRDPESEWMHDPCLRKITLGAWNQSMYPEISAC